MRHRITRGLRAQAHARQVRNLKREIQENLTVARQGFARVRIDTSAWDNWTPRPRTDI